MTTYARITDNTVQEVINFDPANRFTSEIAAMFTPVPDGTKAMDKLNADGTWTVYVPPVAPPAPAPVNPTQWLIDHGPLLDRFGLSVKLQFLESTIPRVVALRQDFYGRKWLDLKSPELKGGFYFLAGVPVPVLGTISAPITGLTMAIVDTVFAASVDPKDNLALRKLYFS